MNFLDIIIVIPILVGLIAGFLKGFIKELISLIAILGGIIGAKYLEPAVSPLLICIFNIQLNTAQPIAYLLIFIVIVLILLFIAHLIDKFLSAIALGGINKFLGGIVGALKYALIVSMLLNVFDIFDSKFHLVQQEKKEKSFAYIPVTKLAPELWKEAKEILIEDKND